MFAIEILYRQIAVFRSSLEHPFNDWTPQHVKQGFSWRPGSVSFATLVESGPHSIEVQVRHHVGEVSPDAVRAIDVPFEVPDDGAIEVASIVDSVPLSVPPGSYQLRCEFLGNAEGVERVRFIFATADRPGFNLARVDAELSPDDTLLTTAEPAA